MSAPDSASAPRRRLFNFSRLEWLTILAIIAALVALMPPPGSQLLGAASRSFATSHCGAKIR